VSPIVSLTLRNSNIFYQVTLLKISHSCGSAGTYKARAN